MLTRRACDPVNKPCHMLGTYTTPKNDSAAENPDLNPQQGWGFATWFSRIVAACWEPIFQVGILVQRLQRMSSRAVAQRACIAAGRPELYSACMALATQDEMGPMPDGVNEPACCAGTLPAVNITKCTSIWIFRSIWHTAVNRLHPLNCRVHGDGRACAAEAARLL